VVLAEPTTREVIGFPVAVTSYQEMVTWAMAAAVHGQRPYAVCAANTHVLSHARHHRSFGAVISRFDVICPDGTPLLWVINAQLAKAQKLKDRVYGPSLMLELLKATEGKKDHSHFLLGGKPETLHQLEKRFSKNEIAGTYSPPFGPWPPDENEKIKTMIAQSGAKYVWVGLGCPKQEQWIADHLEALSPAVYFGIGAAFAFHAGEVRQAPRWIQRFGLEWLYRLCAEPRRLWKRYALHNSLFLYYLAKDYTRG